MKRNFIAGTVFLIATASAFGTAQNIGLQLVWYESNGICAQAQALPCAWIGMPTCVQYLYHPVSREPLEVMAQIYAGKDDLSSECIDPYSGHP